MNAPDPTVANANLWAAYLDAEARRWLPRIAPTPPSGEAAMLLSDVMTALWGGFIAQLFQSNAPEVTRFVEESRAALDGDAAFFADVTTPEPAGVEAWLPDAPRYGTADASI